VAILAVLLPVAAITLTIFPLIRWVGPGQVSADEEKARTPRLAFFLYAQHRKGHAHAAEKSPPFSKAYSK